MIWWELDSGNKYAPRCSLHAWGAKLQCIQHNPILYYLQSKTPWTQKSFTSDLTSIGLWCLTTLLGTSGFLWIWESPHLDFFSLLADLDCQLSFWETHTHTHILRYEQKDNRQYLIITCHIFQISNPGWADWHMDHLHSLGILNLACCEPQSSMSLWPIRLLKSPCVSGLVCTFSLCKRCAKMS